MLTFLLCSWSISIRKVFPSSREHKKFSQRTGAKIYFLKTHKCMSIAVLLLSFNDICISKWNLKRVWVSFREVTADMWYLCCQTTWREVARSESEAGRDTRAGRLRGTGVKPTEVAFWRQDVLMYLTRRGDETFTPHAAPRARGGEHFAIVLAQVLNEWKSGTF